MATPLQGLLQGCFFWALVEGRCYAWVVILNEVKNLLEDKYAINCGSGRL